MTRWTIWQVDAPCAQSARPKPARTHAHANTQSHTKKLLPTIQQSALKIKIHPHCATKSIHKKIVNVQATTAATLWEQEKSSTPQPFFFFLVLVCVLSSTPPTSPTAGSAIERTQTVSASHTANTQTSKIGRKNPKKRETFAHGKPALTRLFPKNEESQFVLAGCSLSNKTAQPALLVVLLQRGKKRRSFISRRSFSFFLCDVLRKTSVPFLFRSWFSFDTISRYSRLRTNLGCWL